LKTKKRSTRPLVFFFSLIKSVRQLSHILSRKHRCPHRPYGIIGKGDQPCAVTEYRSEFIPREGGMRESYKPDYRLQASSAPLDDQTTHK